MAGREMRQDEIQAARIVSAFLNGIATPLDGVGAADATPDYEVMLGNGAIIALEITSSADSGVLRQVAQAFKRAWIAPSLTHHWWIGLHAQPSGPLPRIKDIAAEVEPWLASCETRGVTVVGDTASAELPLDDVRLVRLGVIFARQLDVPASGDSPSLMFSFVGTASSDPSEVNRLVEAAATSNAEKLRASTATKRHLFVWVDGTTPDAELAISTSTPPFDAPRLPEGVDIVWAASVALLAPSGVGGIWRVHPPGSWEMLDVSQL